MRKLVYIMLLCMASAVMSSCFNDGRKRHDALTEATETEGISALDSLAEKRMMDSLSFTTTHHYTKNYNFVVNKDSLTLYRQQPEEILSGYEALKEFSVARDTDSVMIYHGEHLVVADIRIIPTDSIDTVWVQVARDQFTMGWRHESELLNSVVPDDPISQFISIFSDTHNLWTLIVVGAIIVAYTLRIIRKKKAKIVHVNDIASFYPTLLVLTLAVAATLYSSIQLFEPEMWRHYYYHPTLNPFSVPLLLGVFLTLVWMLPIIGIATVEDVMRHLHLDDAILYLCGLAAVCMLVYTVFSISTLYYVGYPLLIIYTGYSVWTFYKNRRLVYYCGRCGKAIHHKGICPHCGAKNM